MIKHLILVTALALPVSTAKLKVPNMDIHCLAANIYHEARGEPYLGKLAVAKVTMNRSKNRSICEAVFEPYQFSWTRIKKNYLTSDPESYKIAHAAIKNKHKLSNFTATHYHATYVAPKWASSLKRLTVIGNHVFYT